MPGYRVFPQNMLLFFYSLSLMKFMWWQLAQAGNCFYFMKTLRFCENEKKKILIRVIGTASL